MYEEQKMEYDRVKFPTEMISTIPVKTTTALKKGTVVFGNNFGALETDISKYEQANVVAILTEDCEITSGKYVNGIIFGEVDEKSILVLNNNEFKNYSSLDSELKAIIDGLFLLSAIVPKKTI